MSGGPESPDLPHRIVNPEGVVPARGYSHAVVAGPGDTIHVAGQVATDVAGAILGTTLAEQLDVALGNVVAVLAGCGAGPEHVVSLTLFTTAMDEYRTGLDEVGVAYRRHFGRYFPAMALVGVTELVPPAAKVEVTAVAVIPS
jgi:enamine deaminase RidA (YjgF/YER057c/UK114 family)